MTEKEIQNDPILLKLGINLGPCTCKRLTNCANLTTTKSSTSQGTASIGDLSCSLADFSCHFQKSILDLDTASQIADLAIKGSTVAMLLLLIYDQDFTDDYAFTALKGT